MLWREEDAEVRSSGWATMETKATLNDGQAVPQTWRKDELRFKTTTYHLGDPAKW